LIIRSNAQDSANRKNLLRDNGADESQSLGHRQNWAHIAGFVFFETVSGLLKQTGEPP
jgi:hypothetical protein